MSRLRRVTSRPFHQGRTTSLFGRPCGFGRRSHALAVSPGISKGPVFWIPENDVSPLRGRRVAAVRSTASPARSPLFKSAAILDAGVPSSIGAWSDAPNATSDTRTAAPSLTHGSSLQASKMRVLCTMRSSTARLAPPRIEFVATSPARCKCPASICARACSNQQHTRSAPPGTRPWQAARSASV